MRPLHVLALMGISLGVGLGGGAFLPRTRAPEHGRALPVAGPLAGFWWTALESQSVAVFHLGPILRTNEGPLRRWTLVVHLPGSPEVLSLVPGLVPCDDVLPISASGELFGIELRPAAGETWGSVDGPEDLVGTVEGLF